MVLMSYRKCFRDVLEVVTDSSKMFQVAMICLESHAPYSRQWTTSVVITKGHNDQKETESCMYTTHTY